MASRRWWRVARGSWRVARRWSAFYGRNLWRKAGHDQVFFLASGITFNVLVTVVPLLLLSISILGILVESSSAARDQVLTFIQRTMPLASAQAEALLFSLIEDRGLLGIIGLVGVVWASTRLFGSLRTVLEIIFEIPPEDRLGIVEGKIHDVKMVLMAGTLFLLSLSMTTALQWVRNYGIGVFGFDAYSLSWFPATVSGLLAFAVTYLMFYIVYRYAPDRWIPRSDAALGALFSAVLFELAKLLFVAYLTEFGRLLELYGSFTSLIVVSFWVYYSSLVFIVGGELARIAQIHRRKGPHPSWAVTP